MERRVRTYLVPQSPTAERRAQLQRAAEREASLLTVVGDHPNILRMVDFVAEGPSGGPCVLFEHFEDAVKLDTFLRLHPDTTFSERLSILEQIADALGYCHRKKVHHRDLHPGSVLVRRRRTAKSGTATPIRALEAKLYDFQLGSRADASHGTIHLTDLGGDRSMVYRAPELVEDPTKATDASDVFSLGALAFFLFTGRPPGTTLKERHDLLTAGGGRLSLASIDDAFATSGPPSADADDGEQTRRDLDELVGMATELSPLERVDDAINWMGLVLDAATTPAPPPPTAGASDEMPPSIDPLDARKDDVLDHGLVVSAVLGTGSTARVLRVREGERWYALKVSREGTFDDRLAAEAATLKLLRGDRIVSLERVLDVGGRRCLLLQDVGDTLANLIAQEGPQSLDYAQRWGDDLLVALRELEDKHVLHRDIKPANLGIRTSGHKRNLFLFDFSLADVDPKKTEVGTPVYRDPFVHERGVWDEAADRFSAAISLYEILTATRPRWGNGEIPASASTLPMSIEPERFDGGVRDSLHAFFTKAFARDAKDRHESADRMRDAWLACFLGKAVAPALPSEPSPAGARSVPAAPAQERVAIDYASLVPATSIHGIAGLSMRAKNALDRAGVLSVADIASLPDNKLSSVRGAGRGTQLEIVAFQSEVLARGLAAARADGADGPLSPGYAGPNLALAELPGLSPAASIALEAAGLDRAREIAEASRARLGRVLARVPSGLAEVEAALAACAARGTADLTSLGAWVEKLFAAPEGGASKALQSTRVVYGLDPLPDGRFARDVRDVARAHGTTTANIYIQVNKERDRWRADPASIDALSVIVGEAIRACGGVAPLDSVAEALLTVLPNAGDDAARAGARALVRAVADAGGAPSSGEAEGAGAAREPLESSRIDGKLWIATSPELVVAARELGKCADDLATRDPLASAAGAREALAAALRAVASEAAAAALLALPPDRFVALAARAGKNAAVSARIELYPRDMSRERAVALSAGALIGTRLSPAQVRRVVHLRYPEALALPDTDAELAKLLVPLGLELRGGKFERRGASGATSNDATRAPVERRSTTHQSVGPTTDPRELDRRTFVEALRTAQRQRSFRVLEVDAVDAEVAARALGKVLGVAPISLEAEVLRGLDAVAAELGIDAGVIAETDAAGPGSKDWKTLCETVGEGADRAVARVLAAGDTLLLTQPGILARYGLTAPLGALRDATQREVEPRAVFLLLPIFDEAGPTPQIHAGALPSLPITLTSQAQRVRIPAAWLTNE